MPRASRARSRVLEGERIRVANSLVARRKESRRRGLEPMPPSRREATRWLKPRVYAHSDSARRFAGISSYLRAPFFASYQQRHTFPRVPPLLPRISGFGYLSDPIPDAEVGYRLRCRVHVSCGARVNSTIYNRRWPPSEYSIRRSFPVAG